QRAALLFAQPSDAESCVDPAGNSLLMRVWLRKPERFSGKLMEAQPLGLHLDQGSIHAFSRPFPYPEQDPR
ncbi:hypothetical protein, partial [Stenotrophomonas maltophilia]|uniref:hypothetical protein n=1 Tax=Stenotrophomonas maltophilia TaxID=40324 RepID=UPI0019542D0E